MPDISVHHIDFTGRVLAGLEEAAKRNCSSLRQAVYDKVMEHSDGHLLDIHLQMRKRLGEVQRGGYDEDAVLKEKFQIEGYLRDRFLAPYEFVRDELKAHVEEIAESRDPVRIRDYIDLCAGLGRPFRSEPPLVKSGTSSKGRDHLFEISLPEKHWHFVRARGASFKDGLTTVVHESLFMSRGSRERKTVGVIVSDLVLLSQALRTSCPVFLQLQEFCERPKTYFREYILEEQRSALDMALRKIGRRERSKAEALLAYCRILMD